jgi:hypothetical protein
MNVKDMSELLKWAHRASHVEHVAKARTARFIVKERRLQCLVVGCKERDAHGRCPRCGAL